AYMATIILIPARDWPGANENYIRRYHNGVWTSLAPPVPGRAWKWFAADPSDADRWLLLMDGDGRNFVGIVKEATSNLSPPNTNMLWLTEDAGATWQPVPLPASLPPEVDNQYQYGYRFQQVEFDPTSPGSWRLTAVDGPQQQNFLWR